MLWTQTNIKSIHDGYSLKIQITISISRGLVFCAFFLWPLFCLSFFSTYGFCMFKLFLHILCVKFRIRASFIATILICDGWHVQKKQLHGRIISLVLIFVSASWSLDMTTDLESFIIKNRLASILWCTIGYETTTVPQDDRMHNSVSQKK